MTKKTEALRLVKSLQSRFVVGLERLAEQSFTATQWQRDEGRHGGGIRYGATDSKRLGRASVNVSQIHYDDEPERKLASATALSTIVHPVHPHAPSVHIHISWTELKSGSAYWRIMADLNPALPNSQHTKQFVESLRQAAPREFNEAEQQGNQYFFIPALKRHRGVAHFYLETYNTGDFSADAALAKRVGEAAINTYLDVLSEPCPSVTTEEVAMQLAYHTLYFFQVLTLDRGTTAGLLVHGQNDIGILGSLPPKIDKNLLVSWRSRMEPPQGKLLDGILAVLPDLGVCTVNDEIKAKLAAALRTHYQAHPEALGLQAASHHAPPTVDNHQ